MLVLANVTHKAAAANNGGLSNLQVTTVDAGKALRNRSSRWYLFFLPLKGPFSRGLYWMHLRQYNVFDHAHGAAG